METGLRPFSVRCLPPVVQTKKFAPVSDLMKQRKLQSQKVLRRSTPKSPQLVEEDKPPSKAKTLWASLRRHLRSTVYKFRKEDMETQHLIHGLEHQRHSRLQAPIAQMIYNSDRKSWITLDRSGRIYTHSSDGKILGYIQAPVPITGLLFTSRTTPYVAWNPTYFMMLNAQFKVIFTIKAPKDISCCISNDRLNKVLTAGAGNLCLWHFGFHNLQCLKVISDGLCSTDVISRLFLKESTWELQSCYAVIGNGMALISLRHGKLVQHMKDLHLRPITSMVYSKVVRRIATSSQDRSIKIWNERWEIENIFVGHTGSVMAIALNASGFLLFSASHDCTIRTWNLETNDVVDETSVGTRVDGLETHWQANSIVSYSGHEIDHWCIQHIYELFTILGTPVTHMSMVNLTEQGSFPCRVVCICEDSAVRLIGPETGEILCTFLLERSTRVVAVEYCLPIETLYVVTEEGDLLRVNAAVNPMRLVKCKDAESASSRAVCLSFYHFMMDSPAAWSQWKKVVNEEGIKMPKSRAHLLKLLEEKNRYLLFIGQENGTVSMVDGYTGYAQYQLEDCHNGRVTALVSNPKSTSIISTGDDFTIKVWRVFPYIGDSLSLLSTFYCSSPVAHMCIIKSMLTLAFQDPNKAIYNITQYNLYTSERKDHHPDSDPMDDITGLCSAQRLKLFASASKDGEVKIWTFANRLLRQLQLNAVPDSLTFSSDRGDLLVGIQGHIYHIPADKYLPRLYQVKLIYMNLPDPIPDAPVPVDKIMVQSLSIESQKRMIQDTSTYRPRILYDDLLEDAMGKKSLKQTEELGQLLARDQELLLIQKGLLKSSKKPQKTKKSQEEAFRYYLSYFYYDQPRIKIPKVDTFDLAEIKFPPKHLPAEDASKPLKGIQDFLQKSILQKHMKSKGTQKDDRTLEIKFTGLKKESALLYLLWLGKSYKRLLKKTDDTKEDAKEWMSEYIEELESEEDVLVRFEEVLAGSEEEILSEINEIQSAKHEMILLTEQEEIPLAKQEKAATAKQKMILLVEKEEMPLAELEEIELDKQKAIQATDLEVPEDGQELVQLQKEEVSSIFKELITIAPVTPTPSSQLQNIFQQFQDSNWFRYIYKNALPELLTVNDFILSLLNWLKIVPFEMGTEIIGTILQIHDQEELENIKEVQHVLLSFLNQSEKMVTQGQHEFFFTCMHALTRLCRRSLNLFQELMVEFMQASDNLRENIKTLFQLLGVHDPNDYFYQEMDTWKKTLFSKLTQKRKCEKWLKKQMLRLQVRLFIQTHPAIPETRSRRTVPGFQGSEGGKQCFVWERPTVCFEQELWNIYTFHLSQRKSLLVPLDLSSTSP
uniref:WD repeat-containing protein 97 isoform X2 n=1 Tax=Geotrypetes seraphini TaxID=260995 RepID=A0A6P8Q1N7_GEOSA|nr:WD repeat-containing protein 97 isoform X2 [Geotrypetes seraphini]